MRVSFHAVAVFCATFAFSSCRAESPARSTWVIESFESGVITARHDGNVFRATCVESSSYSKDYRDVSRSPSCSHSIELVGRELNPFGTTVNPDADGRSMVVLNVGQRLVFRMLQREGAVVSDEEFKIDSVTRSAR
jgi:hypothetical protein